MFDKIKFKEILSKIFNNYNSITEFANISEVSRTYLSQYVNLALDKAPTPKVLKKIADNSKGITTYDELMAVCGYQTENMETFVFNIYKEFKRFADYIKSNDTDSAIDIQSPNKNNGGNVVIWKDNSQANQKFIVNYLENGCYSIIANHSGKLLDVEGASNQSGANVIQWEGNNQNNQKWILKDTGDGHQVACFLYH